VNRTFHIGALLSAYTHVHMAKEGFDEVHRFFDHMTQESLYTHQLLLAGPAMQPELLRQFPWLGEVKVPDFTDKGSVFAFVDRMADKYGEYHDVKSAEYLWPIHNMVNDLVTIWKGDDAR
jgi:hypothetical protein